MKEFYCLCGGKLEIDYTWYEHTIWYCPNCGGATTSWKNKPPRRIIWCGKPISWCRCCGRKIPEPTLEGRFGSQMLECVCGAKYHYRAGHKTTYRFPETMTHEDLRDKESIKPPPSPPSLAEVLKEKAKDILEVFT